MRFILSKTNTLILLGLVFTAVCVCMMSPLNPFSRSVPHTDSSVFLAVAQGMLQGKTPYLDFFDHKGPLVYFIDAAGLALGGFAGVWFFELFFMCVSVIFAYKTARFFGGKPAAFLGAVFSFCALCVFFEYGNLTEEYVLPFIFVSLYIFVKYYFTGTEPGKMRIGITGACFALSLLLRPNMFAVWLSFCMVILAEKTVRKDFGTLFRYALFFVLGITAVLLPVLVYLKITRSLDECIRQYIDFNILYSSALSPVTFFNFALSVYKAVNKAGVPLTVALILLLRKPASMKYGFCTAYALSLGLSFLLIAVSRRNYGHYYMVLVPLFVPAFTLCISLLFRLFSPAKHAIVKYGGLLLVLCIYFNEPIHDWIYYFFEINRPNERGDSFRQAGEFIRANTGGDDAISVFGNRCVFYLLAGRESASKYIYQLPLTSVAPEIFDEYMDDLYRGKPAFIIVESRMQRAHWPSAFSSLIDNEYDECFEAAPESGEYRIFRRK